MLKIFSFLFSVLILVSFHELGHLVVARLCGVKVIRYCIGFGRPIIKKVLFGIEWCLAPIPLGGYVKMLDTRDGGDVKGYDLRYAFDKQHPFKRILIVMAGPVTNLLLSIIIYIFIFSFGVKEVKPIVVSIIPGSISERIGFRSMDRVLSIDNRGIGTFEELVYTLISDLDSRDSFLIKVLGSDNEVRDILVRSIDYSSKMDDLFKGHELGILPFRYTNIVSKVVLGGVADKAGIRVGDELKSVNGIMMGDWFRFSNFIKGNGGRDLEVGIIRRDYNFRDIIGNVPGFIGLFGMRSLEVNYIEDNLRLTPSIVEVDNGTRIRGFIGIYPDVDRVLLDKVYSYNRLGFISIIEKSFLRVVFYSKLTFNLFINLALGRASTSNIGGPISIANITGEAISMGFFAYLEILALLSISLGVLNILPIPPLDGGNILYYMIEWIKGRPLSLRFQGIGLRIGMVIILLLIIISFINDFRKIFG